jgi:hypothetical protein
MSDDEADQELLELLRQSLGLKGPTTPAPPDTGVLKDARYIYNNAIDVAIDYVGTKTAAYLIWDQMQAKHYSPKTWSSHELHPKAKTKETVEFIFTMDLLNFSFWPDKPDEAFTVEYKGQHWTGYWSLVALIQRALEEGNKILFLVRTFLISCLFFPGIPITTPCFWQDQEECSDELLKHIFRSSNSTPLPLLDERIKILRQAGQILYEVGLFHVQ